MKIKKPDNTLKTTHSLTTNEEFEKIFHTLIDTANDAIFIAEAETGFIISANKQTEKLLGIPLNKIIGMHQTQLHPSDKSDMYRDIFDKYSQAGHGISDELLVVNSSGEKIPVEISVSVTEQNGKKFIQGIFRDITGRKNAEKALMDSEEKYSNLFHYSNDSIFIHDLSGEIIDVNQKVLEQFEYSRIDILPLNIFELQSAESADYSRDWYTKIHEKGSLHFEATFKNKRGSSFSADVSASVFKIGSMRVIQSVVRDISERKKTEEELQHHRIRLEEAVKARTQQLVIANENLKKEIKVRKNAEKRLVDYHKQLQSLASQMSLIEEREKRRIATELHDCIGQTLALAKIKLGLLNKIAPSAELKSSAKEILHLIEQTIRETRTLTFELSPPILYELGFEPAIRWLIDQIREKYGITTKLIDDGSDKPFDSNIRFFLFQAIRELMINIAKHAQSDSAKITLTRLKDRLKISVIDYGIGFSDTASRKSGFGLFNIRERINHVNGKFNLSSKPGQGTVVTLEAPFDLNEKSYNKESA
jgi:PAS domain S-box-containing protein